MHMPSAQGAHHPRVVAQKAREVTGYWGDAQKLPLT